MHSVTDFYSFVLVALAPLLQQHLALSDQQKALVLGVGSIASGVIQPAAAWVSDKLDSRLIAVLGLAVAVVGVGMMGYVQGFGALLALQAITAAGVGAFHPPAAAATGQLAGTRRRVFMAVFFLAGMVGGITGNVLTPGYVGFFSRGGDAGSGLRALAWLIAPGLLAVVMLERAIRRAPHRHAGAHDAHHGLPQEERRARWRAVWLLYAGNVLRFTVNMALVYLFTELAESIARNRAASTAGEAAIALHASAINGPLQGAMQVGMGGVALLLAWTLPARWTKASLVVMPLIGAASLIPPILLGEDAATISLAVTLALAGSVMAGVGFGSLVPLTMSLGQHLLPHRTSLVSGMLLGGAWCLAFVGPMLAEFVHRDHGLGGGFTLVAGMLVASSLVSMLLPGKLLAHVNTH
ncbi:MAG: MFS transporter [Phycisphaerales bacterium]|nr:MFS transporter [Phycisphaerales bacterium]